MIRVAIAENGCFRLSDEAILLCVERGMSLAPPLPEGGHQLAPGYDFFTWGECERGDVGQKYGTHDNWSNGFRTNPVVLGVLEELGDRALTPAYTNVPTRFKIIEIPFDSTAGWHIHSEECGPGEYVCENHRTWSYDD